jgi:kynurenine formamidase
MKARPRYRSLPVTPGAPPHSAWGLYGPDDELGALNLLTRERIAAASKLVRDGDRFRLDLPLDEPSPTFFSREPLRHEVFQLHETVLDDRLDNFFPQASTQWDAFSHFASPHGFYNGHREADVRAGKLSIDAAGEKGIAGRGVLVDVAGFRAAQRAPIDPDSSFVITPEMVRATLAAQGTSLECGDILLVRTGWLGWYLRLERAERVAIAERSRNLAEFRLPGLGPAAETAELLWDSGVAAVAADTPMVEAYPVVQPLGDPTSFSINDTLHSRVLALLGIPLGEFFVLDELAAACRKDGRYEFFFTSAPLRIRGGIGSPPNAIALR